ncbi:SDR family NAD(P)-dependent oxidoreductase [Salipiger aestuarii]|uniref:SDR family NAD(P)-dependent oxidoreductase n=1 Tax=Salipiger aestuarii TaxID=568098 RepID=UPI00123B824D|nr:SDR family NAD(P)-dependent oxidoreductase [Salipiger aestuarii]
MLADTEAADFDRVIAVNLRGCFLNRREFARRSHEGRIVNFASELALLGREDLVAYCVSKGAILSVDQGACPRTGLRHSGQRRRAGSDCDRHDQPRQHEP